MAFKSDRFEVKDDRAAMVLRDLCDDINNEVMVPVPRHVLTIRRRMFKYVINALAYNVNYKDLGHTNVMHFTNFAMYPLPSEGGGGEAERQMYPFLKRLFANTLRMNGGYTDHCYETIVASLEADSPYVTRRDFDLALTYFVLTGRMNLSKTVCRSYLFKGSFNPLKDVYKSFLTATILSTKARRRASPPKWTPRSDGCGWFMKLEEQGVLTKSNIILGLKYCKGYKIQYWTPAKVAAVKAATLIGTTTVSTKTEDPVDLLSIDKGLFVVDDSYGLVINYRDCHPQVYTWHETGITRFDTLMDYLCSDDGGAVIRKVERIL